MLRGMGLRNMNDGGVMRAVMASQTTGRGVSSIRHLPKEVYARVSTSTRLASLCLDLDAGVVGNHVEVCQRALANLQHCLSEWRGESREAFVVLGGDVVLLRALFYPFCSREDGVEKPSSSRVLAIRRDCLCLLRELCASVAFFAQGLAAKSDIIVRVFSFMGNNITFDQAVSLAEDVLAAREETLRVQDIPGFSLLVRNFSSRQLASFCRVLAMVAFEPEAGNPWVGPHHEQDQHTTKPLPPSSNETDRWTVADRNHDLILLIPDILARLVKLLTFDKVPVTRERLQGFWLSSQVSSSSSTAHDMEPCISSRSRGLHTQRAGMGALVDEDMLEWNILLDRTSPNTAFVLSNHVEVLFVLCVLCGGKRREQVQNQLAKLGLVGVLNAMFNKLNWTVQQPRATSQGMHGYGCACNPKSALKIQYLRLIHNFCDRDSCNRANKQLLLQPNAGSKNGGFSWNKSSSELKDSEGLMVKISKVLINEPTESLYGYWLALCVEAFLHGADNKDQEFVASTGLMEHLVNEILKGGFRCATSLQINFDLLGELIKFNKSLFQKLNRLLAGDRFDQFAEVLVTNLVDSNVFVRSVVLSMDSFKRSEQQTHDKMMIIPCSSSSTTISSDSYKLGNMPCSWKSKDDLNLDDDMCMITAFVSHNTLRLLRDLMCAVHLSNINQDNICVLNTALIFFIFADKANELPSYLRLLRSTDPHIPHTFRGLLEFWHSYYVLHKPRGRECVSLAYSTQLPFSDWLRVVDCLCAPSDSPCSLLHTHYLHSSCLALTSASELPPRRC